MIIIPEDVALKLRLFRRRWLSLLSLCTACPSLGFSVHEGLEVVGCRFCRYCREKVWDSQAALQQEQVSHWLHSFLCYGFAGIHGVSHLSSCSFPTYIFCKTFKNSVSYGTTPISCLHKVTWVAGFATVCRYVAYFSAFGFFPATANIYLAAIGVSLASAIAESLPLPLDDNFTVPFVAIAAGMLLLPF